MIENRKKITYAGIAFVVLAIAMGLFSGAFKTKIKPHELALSTLNEAAETYIVENRLTPIFETVPGTLRAKEASVISSRLLAMIKSINVRAGDAVKKGDLLVELDNTDLLARQRRWSEQANGYKAQIEQAQPQFERIKQLYEEGVSSKAQLVRAQANYLNLEAQLASAKASLQEADAALSFSQIKAPFDGRIISRLAEPGNMASPGMELLSIYNPGSLRVEVNVRESVALGLNIGDEVEASVASLNKNYGAIIEEISPEAHTGSRSFLVKAAIAIDPILAPGLFVRLNIPVGVEEQLYIPQELVVEMGQLDMVWIDKNNHPSKQIITLGPKRNDGQRLVVKGLSEGDVLLNPEGFSQ